MERRGPSLILIRRNSFVRIWRALFESTATILLSTAILFFTSILVATKKSHAGTSPQGFTMQGTILTPAGLPQEAASVSFLVQIKSPGAENCLLYEESHTLNMSNSGGAFNLIIGSGARAGTDFEDTSTLAQVFNNSGAALTSLTCASGTTYTPVTTHARNIVLTFDDGTGPQTLTQVLSVQSVPFALYADTLQGKTPTDFVQTNTTAPATLSQANLEAIFSLTNYPRLSALLSVPPTNYVQTGANGAASFPSVAGNPLTPSAGQVWYDSSNNVMKFHDGTAVKTLGSGDPAGANSQVQFNSSGTMGADSNLAWDNSNKRLGIGTPAPAESLHSSGAVIVGATVSACTATNKGAIRYNSTTNVLEFCDSSSWRGIPTAASGGCTGPSAFSFTNQTSVPLLSVITSNVITPSGCANTMGVSVTGSGTPQISVNGGPWTTSTTIDPGQTLQVRLTSSGSASTAVNAVVVIGTTTGTTWSVTTKASNTRIFATSTTHNGVLGGLTGADAICQAAAGTNGYGGYWKAVLSDSLINAKDRLVLTYPIVKAAGGATVSVANLWSGSISTPIGATGSAWSATSSDGTRYDTLPCNDWTDGSAGTWVRYGEIYLSDSRWVSVSSTNCSNTLSLYCIEQPDPGCSPAAFNFTDVTGATLSATATSNTITPTGCGTSSQVFVGGMGSPQVSINGGAWVTSGTLNAGDTLAVRLTTLGNYNYPHKARVYIGGMSSTWTVTTMAAPGYRIFATPNFYTGSLGGISGADAICQTAATTSGYGGYWRAILSDSVEHAKDRLTLLYPITRAADGAVVAPANLWIGSISNSVMTANNAAWAATGGDGNLFDANTCSDWTSGSVSYSSRGGETINTNSDWITRNHYACNSSAKLYCVEQANPGCSASAFNFTDVTGASLSTLTTSNVITPAGCATSSEVMVVGNGNPKISINGGAWVTRATLSPGDNLMVRLTSSGNYNYPQKARIYIGNSVSTWSVTTVAGGTRIFVTPNTYNGNLGGLSGADAVCQSAAGSLGYAGNWKALLSSSTVHAKDRLTLTYPVVRATDGAVVATANLWLGSITNTVNGSGNAGVWTATGGDGNRYDTNTCSDWTSGGAGQSARNGEYFYTNAEWISRGQITCNSSLKLYCVEQ